MEPGSGKSNGRATGKVIRSPLPVISVVHKNEYFDEKLIRPKSVLKQGLAAKGKIMRCNKRRRLCCAAVLRLQSDLPFIAMHTTKS
jgi:hypothetical protein